MRSASRDPQLGTAQRGQHGAQVGAFQHRQPSASTPGAVPPRAKLLLQRPQFLAAWSGEGLQRDEALEGAAPSRRAGHRRSAKVSAGMPCAIWRCARTSEWREHRQCGDAIRPGVARACANEPPSDHPHHGASGTPSRSARVQHRVVARRNRGSRRGGQVDHVQCDGRAGAPPAPEDAAVHPQPCSSTSGGPWPMTSTCKPLTRSPGRAPAPSHPSGRRWSERHASRPG